MKKILLIAIIVLSNILFVRAEELPTIEVGSYNAINGEEITIPVSIKNNIGFTYIGFKIDYDIESLEYLDSKIIGLEDFSLKQITNNKNNRIVMYAISLDDSNMVNDDTKVAEIRFKVKDNAKTSDLKISETSFGTAQNRKMEIKTVDGKIVISKKVEKDDTISVSDDFNVENPQEYKWESSDPDIATVDSDGKVTFKKNGEVTITQKDKDDVIINEKTFSVGKINNNDNSFKLSFNVIIICSVILILLLGIIITFWIFYKRKKNK